ncbi:hypothetical protein [Mycobacterium asiaticum]|uniref:Uncharacterized protein n=1 Tax=Mycobacterium asiaticum TaxID=1790 RepID=A0A1A3D078_MYCAS|nr:hypothetical protein [Mycobacterium asiaticum]OBI92403.1 hypothetical protein A9X01_09615 [Mycobacterium asiaticum]
MTEQRRAADEVVRGHVVTIATRLTQRIDEISLMIQTGLEEQIPELGSDAGMANMLAASVRTNLLTVFDVLLHGSEIDRIGVPEPALEYARLVAQHDLPLTTLVRAYRLGQRHLTELVFAELSELAFEPNTRVAVIEGITAVVLDYVDRVSQQMAAQYEDERGHWLENQNTVRAMRVQELLGDNTDVDVEAASAALRYPLHWQHLGLVVWLPGHECNDDELARIQGFIGGLADSVDSSASPLIAAADRTSAWIWLPFRAAPGDITTKVRHYVTARTESLCMAIGAVGSGVGGFRRSHRQAQRVRAAILARAERSPGRRRVVAAATDAAMTAAGLLGTTVDEVRDWVSDVLGPLASSTDDDAVLRETLRLYLHNGAAHEIAAQQLNLTFNALKSRLERAVARRGRPISDRVDVELALFACHWYGPTVLRPGH